MGRRIFISYRKKDEPGFTKALFYQLRDAFDRDHLFYDLVSIETGQNFVKVLTDAVEQCDVLLAVVGPNWLDIRDEKGLRRLDDAKDFVRIEIEAGLKLGKRVMPVLVNDAPWPERSQLPPAIADFAECNYRRLANDQFDESCELLIAAVRKALDEAEEFRRREEEEARLRAEREAKERAEQERQRKVDEAALATAEAKRLAELKRLELLEKFTPEQIRELEERTDWDGIKDSKIRTDFVEHLSKYPRGLYDKRCRGRIAEIDWLVVEENPTRESLIDFRERNPESRFDAEAQNRIRAIEERWAWEEAAASNSIRSYEAYLDIHRDGANAEFARNRLLVLTEERDWPKVKTSMSSGAVRDFLRKYPSGTYAEEARKLLDELAAEERDWQALGREKTVERLDTFLKKWPNGRFEAKASETRITLLQSMLDTAIGSNDLKALKAFLDMKPGSLMAGRANSAIASHPDEKAWLDAKRANTIAALSSYWSKFPQGHYAAEARTLIAKMQADSAYSALPANATTKQLEDFLKDHGTSEHATKVRTRIANEDPPMWFVFSFWFVILFITSWLILPRTMLEWTGVLPGVWQSSPFYSEPYVPTTQPDPAPITVPDPAPVVVPSEPAPVVAPADSTYVNRCIGITDMTSCQNTLGCSWLENSFLKLCMESSGLIEAPPATAPVP
ncbi:MAG: toll/interleukin-1 receptor domain-containing protein [Hyphomicrobium sp.]|nr:toll/interleukin-1 receptor domain-containing protein [Hyphomicrobium sp.]